MTEETLIALRDVTLSRDGQHVLDHVSLELRRGEGITVIGPNGAGKTTLLRIVLGLVQPDAGEVTRTPGIRFGYVPQHMALNNLMPMTVERFLALATPAPALAPMKLLERTGIAHIRERTLHALSGGEMQRLLLARALMTAPDVLVLDEPAQHLDIAGQIGIYRLIEEMQEEYRLSMLLVSHDLHLVMKKAKQVICLFHHICCSGHPESLLENEEFHALYGPQIAEVLAYYPHSHTHAHEHFDAPIEKA